MASFLELCQRVGQEAGTVEGAFPSTVVGQTGYLGKIVIWTNAAWRHIQNAHGGWRWMLSECYMTTVDGTQHYAYTAFTDVAAAATVDRFGEWIRDESGKDSGWSIYDTAVGVADEGPLVFMDWDAFYRTLRGTQSEDKPARFTIAPDNRIALYKTPDASTYRVRGRYRKDVQNLAADATVPECPVRFHDTIVDVALMMLGTHDESPQISLWQMRKSANFTALERDQLPQLKLTSEPLA